MKFKAMRQQLIRVGDLCYQRHLVAGTAGNLSARVTDIDDPGSQVMLVTASGTCLGMLEPEHFSAVSLDEEIMDGSRPTSELPLHRTLYNRYSDVGAIVHTHSPAASAFACAGRDLKLLTREAKVTLVTVPLVPFAPEGSEELGERVADTIEATMAQLGVDFTRAGAALLEQHGVVAWAGTILQAFHLADLVEHTAVLAVYHGTLTRTV